MLKRAFWLFGIAIFLLVIFLPGYTKLQEFKDRNHDLETKIKRLQVENALLQQELQKLDADPLYQERVARQKMGVVRKGEIPVKIIPEDK
jgi:cell division protein FtsB